MKDKDVGCSGCPDRVGCSDAFMEHSWKCGAFDRTNSDVWKQPLLVDAKAEMAFDDMIGGHIYPLTVVRDRYTGSYSGGRFTAWNVDVEDVPEDINEDDVTCYEFWWGDESKKYAIGKGRTPNEAIKDLAKVLKERGEL